jgi:c-di-GMP-related signal transduction protein
MGLLSAIDALTDRPIAEVITQIPLPHDVTAALLGGNNTFARAYSLVQAFERGIPSRLTAMLTQLKLPLEPTSEIYRQAVVWADASLKV